MKRYQYLLLLFLEIYLVSCNKHLSYPALQTSRFTISNLSVATTFKDMGAENRNSNLSIGKSIMNHNISTTVTITSTDTMSTWQHVFMGYGILNYLSKALGVPPITDSVNLNNLSGYSRNLVNGVYDISLSTKPTTHLADSFIRFSATNLGFRIIQNTGINFVGITKDAVITIGAGNIQKGSTPIFTTVQNGLNVQFKFGIKNGYYFLYINDQTTGIVSVIAPNGQNLVKTLTVSANIQFNISLSSPSKLSPLSLTITPFTLKNLSFDRNYTVSTFLANIPNGSPGLISIDNLGNIYVPEHGGNSISIIDNKGNYSEFAGTPLGDMGSTNGTRLMSTFTRPTGVTYNNGILYVADQGDDLIRKIDQNGIVSTLAGSGYIFSTSTDYGTDGNGLLASFYNPYGIGSDMVGNLYVSDIDREKIRKIDSKGNVSTLAGTGIPYPLFQDGPGNQATFTEPRGLVADSIGNVYVADFNTIRKIDLAGNVTTYSGQKNALGSNDGNKQTATFNHLWGIAIDKVGNLYVTDIVNHNIRRIDTNGYVTTIAGNGNDANIDGLGALSSFGLPYGIAIDNLGNIFVSDYEFNSIRKLTPNN